MKFKIDWFLGGMAAATALAWLDPAPGAAGGWLHPELLTKAGIALIFLLHGLALSFRSLKAGALNWRLHLLVQGGTFLLFPLLGLALAAAFAGKVQPDLRLGLFFLCALPSTVSSSVALTAAACGNVPGALFNATLSSLLGIFLTPLWMALMMKHGGSVQPIAPVIQDLLRWLVMPLLTGQALRPLLGAWAGRNMKGINRVDRATVLLLVYTSFCESFRTHVWSGRGPATLALVLGAALALFAVAMTAMSLAANLLRFSREDRIAAMFCGSKKTLASGVPMAQLLFAGHPGIGLILLPIMIYHPLQLAICGTLAERWRQRDG
jgi:sodium/bile acid cotransporter 7